MENTAIAFGTFDGLHLGHKAVINNVLISGYKPLALSFSVPPKFADGYSGKLLMTRETKSLELKKLGTEPVLLDFNYVKDLSPEEFLDKVLIKYSPKLISVGFDFRFGKGAVGDIESLKIYCNEHNIDLKVSKPVTVQNTVVSSSKIRKLVKLGDITAANGMLGYPFFFSQKVVKGDQRGRTIGFPTINQNYPAEMVCPKLGVYAGYTEIDGLVYKTVTNIGFRPTFKTDKVTAETYILNYSGDIYNKNIRINLLKFLREEKKFNSLDELKNAIEIDKQRAIEINL